MKKIFTLLLALVATTALWAYDFSVKGIYYNILADETNEVEVTSGSTEYSGSVTIPKTVTYNSKTYSVTTIGDYAFCDCSGLTSVTIPNSVTSIGNYAFTYCPALTSITIPNSVKSIGEAAFSSCDGLTSVTIPSSVTSLGDWAFAWCSGLTSITIPNSVTRIGDAAFLSCSSLTSITIPNSVKRIGDRVFGYSGLTSITIPNSVTSIGDWAFYECPGLTSVTIPNSVTSIEGHAFAFCPGLTSVTCKAVNLPEMGEGVFWNSSTAAATLYVPGESLELYQAAEKWKEFGTILPISQVEADVENIGSDNGYEVMGNGKIMRNGQLIIIRDGVEYNAMGVEL